MTADQLKFNEALARGRELTREERLEQFRRLARSPYFPALVVEVREAWEQFGEDIGDQKKVTAHGSLEHCAGSMHALKIFEGKLKTALKIPKQQEAPPQDE